MYIYIVLSKGCCKVRRPSPAKGVAAVVGAVAPPVHTTVPDGCGKTVVAVVKKIIITTISH
jgi:hypothetical protein